MARQFIVVALVFIAVVGLASASSAPAQAPASTKAAHAPTKAATTTTAGSPKAAAAKVPSASAPVEEVVEEEPASPPAPETAETPSDSPAALFAPEPAVSVDDETTSGAAALKISGAVAIAAVAGFFS